MDLSVSRIFDLLDKNGLTAKEAALQIGIDPTSFSGWKRGKYKPGHAAIVKIAEFFNVPIEYLSGDGDNIDYKPKLRYSDEALKVAGWWDQLDEVSQAIVKGDILRRLEGSKATAPAGQTEASGATHKRRALPVEGRAAAGIPIEMINGGDDPDEVDDSIARDGDMVIIAVGDSMVEAGIQDGAHCVIRPTNHVENGQIALVAVDDCSTIKRFYKDDYGFRLVPCNPSHPVQHYGPDTPIRILGRFVAVAN